MISVRQWGLNIYVVLFFLFLQSPLLIIIVASFSPDAAIKTPPDGLSFRWYAELWRQFLGIGGVKQGLASSLWTSVWLSVLSTAGATVAGVAAAVGLRQFAARPAEVLRQCFLLPLLFPQVVIGVGLLLWFSSVGGIGSSTRLLLGHMILGLPYVVVTTTASLETLDRSIEEAAMNLGAGMHRTLWYITLPLCSSGILTGALFAWLTSFSNFTVSFFLYSGEVRPLPVWIFEILQFVIDPSLAALAAVLVLMTFVILIGANRLFGLGRLAGLQR